MKKVFTYIFIIGFFTALIGLGFRGKYSHPGNFNQIITIVGFVLLFPFLAYFIRIYFKSRREKINNKNNQRTNFQSFIKNSQVMILNFEEVEIIKVDGKDPDFFTSAIGKLEANEKKNILVELRIPFNKRNMRYTFLTSRNIFEIKMLIEAKKSTLLYYDEDEIFIDLEFLNSNL